MSRHRKNTETHTIPARGYVDQVVSVDRAPDSVRLTMTTAAAEELAEILGRYGFAVEHLQLDTSAKYSERLWSLVATDLRFAARTVFASVLPGRHRGSPFPRGGLTSVGDPR